MSYNPYVTMIEQLPELDELENRPAPLDRHIMERPNPNEQRIQKHIRGIHRMDNQSGMQGNLQQGNLQQGNLQQGNLQQGLQQGNLQQGNLHTQYPDMLYDQQQQEMPNYMAISCIDIARHIQGCPICSRFYHNDKTVYIIAIVVLSIICILLLKKILNV